MATQVEHEHLHAHVHTHVHTHEHKHADGTVHTWIESLITIDRRKVLILFTVDGQVSERVVLLDAAEFILACAEGFEELRDRIASQMAIFLIGDKKAVPVGVRGRYVQEVALRKIPAFVPAKLFQVHRLGDDHPLVRCQFGCNIESVIGVQGERDSGFHFLDARRRPGCLIANRDTLTFKIAKVLGRLPLRQFGRALRRRERAFLSAAIEYPRMC